jgi:PadR family transcriptional regulator, regulatory protein PadR
MQSMIRNSPRQSQLLKGVLDLCLLAVIAQEPAYGYEMTKRLASRGLAAVGEGSIYPVLGRLERDGLVATFRQASNGGPPRKYYRATPNGMQTLARWRNEWAATRSSVDAVVYETEGVAR